MCSPYRSLTDTKSLLASGEEEDKRGEEEDKRGEEKRGEERQRSSRQLSAGAGQPCYRRGGAGGGI